MVFFLTSENDFLSKPYLSCLKSSDLGMSRQPLVLAQELLYRYLGKGAVMAITPKEKELTAVGISVAAGCEP